MPRLEWIGKEKVVNHAKEVPFYMLEKQYSFGEGRDGMVIHGDNLLALKSLLPEYEGRVKCIYIDPPYNTGNEGWVYNDNVNDPRLKKWLGEVVGKEGEDLSRHDKWLCMMYPRLRLLHRLLNPVSGVIFISIDENEAANLKLICNEIFGNQNHIATIAWQKRYSRENREAIGDSHEYIVIYATNPEVFKQTRHCLPLTDKQLKSYSNPDNDPRGAWQSVSLLAQGFRPNQMYEIIAPNGRRHIPPEGNCWKVVETVFQQELADNRVTFGNNGNGVPRRKMFLSEAKGLVPWTWWPHEEVGHTDEAKKEMKAILGDITVFDTPKPTRLIERILQIATDKDSIILDSFAGSGTTAHAVLNLNKKDGGNRKFILIEMMDYAETITAERVRRVISGYGEGKNATSGTGGGFDFYEIGAPLMEKGVLNESVSPAKIRRYVWYMETHDAHGCASVGVPRDGHKPTEPPREGMGDEDFLGIFQQTAYYFHYRPKEATLLDEDYLATITEKAESYVIYADRCLLSEEFMARHHIVFKKIPRDIAVL